MSIKLGAYYFAAGLPGTEIARLFSDGLALGARLPGSRFFFMHEIRVKKGKKKMYVCFLDGSITYVS